MAEFAALPIAVLDLADVQCRAQLHALWRSAYQAEASLIGVPQFPPLGVSLDALAARPGTFFGIGLEGCLIGAIEVEETDPATRLIAALVIDPAYARRGLGRRLVGFVLDGSPARVRVSTSAANVPALALYRSAGFREIATCRSPEGIALCSLEWRRQE